MATYQAVSRATERELIRSLHTPTLGGLGVAFAMVAFGGELGMRVDLSLVPAAGAIEDDEILFSESNSRFIATVAPENREEFERTLSGTSLACVGEVTAERALAIQGMARQAVVWADVLELKKKWKETLDGL